MIEHVVVSEKEGRYHGWPANNGIWSWGDEILVAFTQADYIQQRDTASTGSRRTIWRRAWMGGRHGTPIVQKATSGT